MDSILRSFLKEGSELLANASLAPLTNPHEDLNPLTPPAIFLIHWAASTNNMIESNRILQAFKESPSTTETIITLRHILGQDLQLTDFTTNARQFLEKYYRTGWKYNYRDDFFQIFQEVSEPEEVVNLEISRKNFDRIEPCLTSRLKEWLS